MGSMRRQGTRNLVRWAAALLFAAGLQLAAAPAQAGSGWHGGWGGGWGGWHGGWWGGGWHRATWCCGWGWWGPGISLNFAAVPYYPYYYYPYPYYPPYPAYAPPVTVTQQPPQPAGPATQQSWYYCDSPHGYYPYIQNCSSGWHAVPVVPPGTH